MNLKQVDLTATDLRKALNEARTYREGVDQRFLCKQKYRLFVSDISLLKNPDRSMPANVSDGCLYVLGPDEAIPIDKLDAIYYIEGGDYE
jgi:hypothetical protein